MIFVTSWSKPVTGKKEENKIIRIGVEVGGGGQWWRSEVEIGGGGQRWRSKVKVRVGEWRSEVDGIGKVVDHLVQNIKLHCSPCILNGIMSLKLNV